MGSVSHTDREQAVLIGTHLIEKNNTRPTMALKNLVGHRKYLTPLPPGSIKTRVSVTNEYFPNSVPGRDHVTCKGGPDSTMFEK